MKKLPRLHTALRSLPLCAVLTIILVSGCSRETADPRTPPPVPVQIASATKQALPVTQKAIGTVQVLRSVTVKSQVDGIIQGINFKEGDEVKAGDLLFSLDRRPFENSLQMAKAELANAQAQAARAATDAGRYERLDQASVVSKEQYAQLLTQAQTTKAQVDAKEAAVANVQLQLDYTSIRAPIDGRTGQLTLHEGSLVKANDAAFSLVKINQMAPISVAFSVPERTLDAVRTALAAGSVAARVSGRDTIAIQTDGVVDFIDNSVDPTTGMITLKARFVNADHALWPGQFVNIELQLSTEADQIVVPTPAVQTGQKGKQIYVVKSDRTVELRPVIVGRIVGDFTSITSGIAAGESVVIDGQLRLVPGSRIEVRSLEEAARGPTASKSNARRTSQ